MMTIKAQLAVLLLYVSVAAGDSTIRVVAWNLHGNQNPAGQLAVLRSLSPDVCLFSEGVIVDPLFISIGEDQSLDAWGVHWESVRDTPANPAKARQETLDRLARQPVGVPIIQGGDFNVQRYPLYMSVPDGSIELMEAAGYTSAIETPTYHAGYPQMQLDWIFTTDELRIIAAGTAGTSAESDHLLLWADIQIPEPATCSLLILGTLILHWGPRWR